jgi:hypothetical protein
MTQGRAAAQNFACSPGKPLALLDVVCAHLRLLSWLSAPMSSAILDTYLLRDRRRPGPLITLKNLEILFLRITALPFGQHYLCSTTFLTLRA